MESDWGASYNRAVNEAGDRRAHRALTVAQSLELVSAGKAWATGWITAKLLPRAPAKLTQAEREGRADHLFYLLDFRMLVDGSLALYLGHTDTDRTLTALFTREELENV